MAHSDPERSGDAESYGARQAAPVLAPGHTFGSVTDKISDWCWSDPTTGAGSSAWASASR